MSADHPDIPASILDQTLPIDPEYIQWNTRTNNGEVIKNFDYCIMCQKQNVPGTKLCKRCKMAGRLVPYYVGELVSLQKDGVSGHFRMKVDKCKVTAVGPGGHPVEHKLTMKQRLVVNLANEEAHLENYCDVCNYAYTWERGRKATSNEMEDCRAGKIPAKETKKIVSFA